MKFGEAIFRNLRVLGDLRGGISFSSGCVAILGALLVPPLGNAQPLCVRLIDDRGIERSVPVHSGSAMRLNFRHSIYGSQVQEVFALRRDGFQLTQLRYGEARLVDFYGYENGKLENSTWVVNPKPALFPSIQLNLTTDAFMSLHFDSQGGAKPIMIQPTVALRLTIVSCKSSAHG